MEIEIQEDLIYPEQFILHGDLGADRSMELIRKIGLSFDKSIYFENPFEFTFIDSHDFYVDNKVIFPLNEEIPNNTPRIKLSELDHAFLEREKRDLRIVEEYLNEDPILEKLPRERRTKEVSLAAVKNDASNIMFVPSEIFKNEFLIDAIAANGEVINYINKDQRTDEMYWAAVESYPEIYKEIPDRLKVEGLHELLVGKNGINLRLLDVEDRTPEICQIALDSFPDITTMGRHGVISYIPHSDICLHLLEDLGPKLGAYNILWEMDPKVIDYAIAAEAIRQDVSCIALLPDSIKGPEFPAITEQERSDINDIASDPFMDTFWYERLSPERKTEIVSRAAANTVPEHIKFVPEKYLDREMYCCAIKASPQFIQSVKSEFKDIEMLLLALKVQEKMNFAEQDTILKLYAGADGNIQDICKQIVEVSPTALRLLPEEYRTSDLCRHALRNCTSHSDYGIVKSIIHPEVCAEALTMDLFTGEKSPIGAAKLMEQMDPIAVDKNVAEKAISLDGHCIRYIPRHLQTEKMLIDAMKTAGPLIILSRNLSEKVKTPKAYRAARYLDPKNFHFIPEQLTEIPKNTSWKEKYNIAQLNSMEKSDAISYFYHLNPKERTESVSMVAVDISSDCFSEIPHVSLTEKIILKALEKDGDNLKNIQPSEISDEMYLTACDSQPDLICYLPTHLIRYDMCIDAVDYNSYNLKSVPGELMSKELCEHAIKNEDPRYLEECKIINNIPYPDIRLQMLKDNPTITFALLKELLPEYLTKDIATLAIEQDIRSITVVPETMVNNELKITAQEVEDISMISEMTHYQSEGYCQIPDERKTENVSFAATCADPESLYYVPKESMSDRVIFSALLRDGAVLRAIPEERRTEEMYLTAIKSHKGSEGILGELPQYMLTPEICRLAIEASGYNLEYVPEEMITPEICRTALYSSADLGYEDCVILHDIPFTDVCLEGLKGYIKGIEAEDLLEYVHPKAFDATIANWFVEQDPLLFNDLPTRFQTEELAEKAVQFIDKKDLLDMVKQSNEMTDVFQEAILKEATSFITSKSSLAELCIEIEKKYPEFWHTHRDILPREVAEGFNIFTLYRNLQKITPSELSLQNIRKVFQGEPVLVSKINSPLGILENQYIQFNKNEMTLSACPYPNKQEDREKNQKQEQKKENREPDTSLQKNNRNRRMKF